MANVHRLNDMLPEQAASPTGQASENMFGYTAVYGDVGCFSKPPAISREKLHFFHVLSPWFKFLSVTFILTVVTILVYIATIAYNANLENVLSPRGTTLDLFGSNNAKKISEGQVWRLFTAIFLHASGEHILGNGFALLLIGFSIEARYGKWNFLASYLFCGIAANLFSDMFSLCASSLGASTSVMGLVGIFTGEIVYFWEHIRNKYMAAYFTVLMLFFFFIVTGFAFRNVDLGGHVGGFLNGLFLCPLLNYKDPKRPRWYKYGIGISITLIAGLLGLSSGLMWGRSHASCPSI
ncbi:hypothetical protein IE077_003945 [Cardiosporidium cionae]|uniref:Rhomboid-like protease n=1 Tax=Cardiosporidium cionae TaxID=476202 RepID=A0ABQ7JFC0_9APIC|nr:hypothetical protein IE077_003945 [Cardiosporidium cionae]|eukprot:KAF8822340.1 hypothetical protein IE077_003945 [Cardiosporidium cionae]